MKETKDLSNLDRNTLRAWRVMNLVGWGAFAAVAGLLSMWIVWLAMVGLLGGSSLAMLIAAPVMLVVSGGVLGTIVGSHVYRSPVAVAIVAGIALPIAYPLIAFGAHIQEVGVAVGFGLAEALIGAAVARSQWSRRPRALRAGSGD